MANDWKKVYQDRIVSADTAVQKGIQSGNYLVFGHAAAAPIRISKALYDNRELFHDLKVFHMLFFGKGWHLQLEMKAHLTPMLNFLEGNSRPGYADKWVQFIPCHFHQVPQMFRDGYYPVDVAIIQVSLPDENGYCSFGISNDYTKTAADCAKVVIAEINCRMPYIGGDNLIHLSKIDYMVLVDEDLVEVPCPPIGELEMKIGQNCASLIKDGATLQLGIGAIPDAVLQCLKDHKNLGIHTEMFTDGVMHMLRSGVINGSKKNLNPGKVVTTLISGSKELYEFLDHNPDIELYPVDYTNDPFIIGQQDNMVSINSCIEIDLTGQVASESIGYNQFSGTGGQVDFLRGASRSKGGISILAFPSTAKKGTESRIQPILKEGATVTTMRNDVDYIVTEYGVARLRGKSLRERAEALVQIAHPNFRPMLEEAIQKRFY